MSSYGCFIQTVPLVTVIAKGAFLAQCCKSHTSCAGTGGVDWGSKERFVLTITRTHTHADTRTNLRATKADSVYSSRQYLQATPTADPETLRPCPQTCALRSSGSNTRKSTSVKGLSAMCERVCACVRACDIAISDRIPPQCSTRNVFERFRVFTLAGQRQNF